MPQHQPRAPRAENPNFFSVYVGNLPQKAFYDLDFLKFFTTKGYKIQKAKVIIDKHSGRPKGFGFLTFYSKIDAEKCIEEMNNHEIQGMPIRMQPEFQKEELKFDERANVLVKNLDKEVTQEQLFNKFKEFGKIISSKLEKFPNGESRGFAYIQFDSVESADNAINAMNAQNWNGKEIEVVKHTKKDLRQASHTKFNNLFVQNLPDGTTEPKLREMFAHLGEISSVKVNIDDQGNSKAEGFVCFVDSNAAEEAIRQMNK